MKHRWQRKKTQRDHGDDWLMTYADMITLLLCFFVVSFFASLALKNHTEPPPAPAQTQQVETPVQPQPQLIGVSGGPDQDRPKQPEILMGNLPFHDPALDEAEANQPAALAPEPALPAPENSEPPKAQASAAFEQKGDRLTTMEMSSGAFFGSGSAELSESGKAILRDVAAKIKTEAYKDYQITVEGHTDDSPIKTLQFPSNWELSTARASAVVHFFLDQGIAAQRLRAAGYADTYPKAPNHDGAGKALPDNQAQNRRVVIKLEKIDRALNDHP